MEIDVKTTAAAGLVLHLAGDELSNAKYKLAAIEAARAVVAVQMQSGQFPAEGTLAAKAFGKPEVALVPDRRATCAALGLLLAVIDVPAKDGGPAPAPDARLVSAAVRAAYWLASQQPDAGGWPVGYPSDAAPKDAKRIIRLDDTSYRDATFALLLASHVLDKEPLRQAAGRSITALLSLRIRETGSPGVNLWSPAYALSGAPLEDIEEFPHVIDTLASSYAMQTLLAAHLLNDAAKLESKVSLLQELTKATDSIAALPRRDGEWDRWYNLFLKKPEGEPQADQAEEAGGPPAPQSQIFQQDMREGDRGASGDFGLKALIVGVNLASDGGAEKFCQGLQADLSLRHRLAVALAGLSDESLLFRLPATPEAAKTYLEVQEADWLSPAGLPEEIGRVYVLTLRAKVERMHRLSR